MLKILEELITVIRQRKETSTELSYTSKLLNNKKLNIDKVKEEIEELINAIEKDTKKVEKIAKIEDVEKESTVIGLMMYLGYPLALHEHLLMSSEDKCFEKKEVAETNSFATYECAEVKAIVKDGKIISIIEEIRVLE